MSFNEQELRDAYANAGKDQFGGSAMWEKFKSTRALGSGKRTQDISKYKTLLAELDNERRNPKPKPTPTPTPRPTPTPTPRPTPRPTPTPTPRPTPRPTDLAVGSNKNFDNNIVGNNNSDIGNDRSYNYGNRTEADYNEKKSSPGTPNKLQAAKDLAEARLTSNVTTDLKQTVGSNKDFKNVITGNKNKNIGNDYSVNISGQGGGLNNMKDAMGFIGLNDNRAAKDNALFNPYDGVGLSMQAINNAAGKDVDQRIYNSIGYDMNYYDDKAKEIDNMTFGDLWQFKAPKYSMASSPSDPFKKVKS